MAYFAAFTQHVWNIFVAERKPGWKNLLLLFAVCSSVSLIANVLLFLAGYTLLTEYPVSAAIIFMPLWVILSISLFFFRYLRCFSALFFLTCGMHEGRNTLVAAGTGAVVAGNIQNIFYNLKQLADSVTCILESQHLSFLDEYIKAIWWIYNQSKALSNPLKDIVEVNDKLDVSYFILDEGLNLRLNKTRLGIQNVVNQISSVLALHLSLAKKVLPLLGTAFILLGTYRFLQKFLGPHTIKFKNTYITKEFIRYNEQQWQQQKLSVLPLSKEERKVYAMVPSFCQTYKEKKCTIRFFLPVLANLCIWILFGAIDYLLYWLIFSVSKHLQDFPELEVHLKLYYHKNADKFIFNNGEIVDNKTSFEIPLFEHVCIPTPQLSLNATWIQLGTIIIFLTVLGLFTSTFIQLKILVTTSFFPKTDMKRIEYLHAKLLNRRSKLSERKMKRKLNSFATISGSQSSRQ
ncbi:dendritic cell-specific transmembrane protein isoform X2 [Sceloporus undulatus]|uniref:dendritic cell-specific transmembrane protein isoform X2 n=1 Tax=Sceloporus undulatus TaxID=8520 RepID=UPI001C4CF8A8|nr:dendritic cell-specific transmembrane protein isoform X2 [Sceloporus undulatus]